MTATFQNARGAFAAGCDRLIAAAPDAELLRLRRRMVCSLLAAPLVLLGSIGVASPHIIGPAAILAAGCVVFATFWMAALGVASNGREDTIGAAILGLAAGGLSWIIALSGGLSAPIALLLAALAFEPWWIFRSRKAAWIGGLAALASAIGVVCVNQILPATTPSALGWLPVAAYLGWALARLTAPRDVVKEAKADAPHFSALTLQLVLKLALNGDVVAIDGPCEKVVALSPDLLAGQGLFDRIHVADRVAYLRALSEIRNGSETQSLLLRFRRVDAAGQPVFAPLDIELAPIGQPVSSIALAIRDGSKFADLQSRLDAALAELDQFKAARANQLAAVGHELRTPLNAIIGFSDMLAHELHAPLPDIRQREQVSAIRDAGQHLLAVVNALLDTSKLELGVFRLDAQPFVLEQAVSAGLSMVAPQAQAKQVNLQTRLDPTIGEVIGDRCAIQQILINLLSNAVKFTPSGGAVVLGAARSGQMIEFWVRDDGVGLTEGDIAQIGAPFTQFGDAAQRREGTGLGLALVKNLVKLQGGAFVISSKLGAGTTVTISLPLGVMPVDDATAELEAGIAALKAVRGRYDGAFRKAG